MHDMRPAYRPIYPIAEAARLLRLPATTLRNWTSPGPTALINRDDLERSYLSFMNLVEAHVLAAIRQSHPVALPNIRRALDYVQRKLKVDRPLIDPSFQRDGTDLFIEEYGESTNISKNARRMMKEIVDGYLQRINRDRAGLPRMFYPFTHVNGYNDASKSDPYLVMISPEISFGRPVVKETGVPIAEIHERWLAGDSPEDLERAFNLAYKDAHEVILWRSVQYKKTPWLRQANSAAI